MVASAKRIAGDIRWVEDQDHSPGREFRVDVECESGHLLQAVGTWNPRVPAVSYCLIHPEAGRVYGLCLGKGHHNPTCEQVGETHKHRWTEEFRDKQAYRPLDITAPAGDPVAAWDQFCLEARITCDGRMQPPPAHQEVLPL